MARNRKHQSAAIRFGPAIKAFLLCALIGGSGIGYVWQKEQINKLSKEQGQREHRLTLLFEENSQRRKQLANMRNPQFLEMRIKELNLGLMPPQPAQVWRLVEPARDSLPAAPEPPYATPRQPGAVVMSP